MKATDKQMTHLHQKGGAGRAWYSWMKRYFLWSQGLFSGLSRDMFMFTSGAPHRKHGTDIPTGWFSAISVTYRRHYSVMSTLPVRILSLLTYWAGFRHWPAEQNPGLPSFLNCPSEKDTMERTFLQWGQSGHIVSCFPFKIIIRFYLKYSLLH